jgi:hypothetical protein
VSWRAGGCGGLAGRPRQSAGGSYRTGPAGLSALEIAGLASENRMGHRSSCARRDAAGEAWSRIVTTAGAGLRLGTWGSLSEEG